MRDLVDIALQLYINLESITILIMSSLLIHEYTLHLSKYPLIFFQQCIAVFSVYVLYHLIKCIPKCAIVSEIVFLISFSDRPLLAYRNTAGFCILSLFMM